MCVCVCVCVKSSECYTRTATVDNASIACHNHDGAGAGVDAIDALSTVAQVLVLMLVFGGGLIAYFALKCNQSADPYDLNNQQTSINPSYTPNGNVMVLSDSGDGQGRGKLQF